MSTLTIRNINRSIKDQLQLQAVSHGWSIEQEIQQIIIRQFRKTNSQEGLGSRLHRKFSEVGGVELELPVRQTTRYPKFKEPS